MFVTKTIALTKAKIRLERIINDVVSSHAKYVITQNGKPKAAVMAVEELESLIETLDILTDPKAVRALKNAEKDIKAGRLFTHEAVFSRS